jgi:hypothetical protein
MRILLTNFALEARTGAELYVYDLAVALLARGHQPVAWAPRLGRLAERLRDATVPVAADLDDLGAPPDVIHGQDNHHFLTALLRFPGVPGVRVCHGWVDERPLRVPRIRHYVCVDDTVRDRALGEWGLPAASVSTIRNFVDLARFTQRPPLPAMPARALVFSNYAAAHATAVQAACAARGLAVDVVGASAGTSADAPETILGGYDVVFGKGRCAIEALAVGAAVVLCDAHGLGPLVTSTNLDDLRRMNFGMRALNEPVTAGAIGRALDRYDAADARRVSDRIRAMAGLDDAVDQLLAVYERAVAQAHASAPTADDDLRALSHYLQDLAPRLQWTQSTRGLAYQILRRGYFAMQRVPGLRGVLASRARAQRLQRRLQRG